MDGDETAAIKWADVWFSVLIQGKVPAHNASRPVTQDSRKRIGPFCPIGCVIWRFVIGAAFCPIRILFWEHIVYAGHGRGITVVAVPRDAIHVLINIRITDLVHSATP